MPWQIDTATPIPHDLRAQLLARVDIFDRTYSRFRNDSLVASIATTPGTYEFPADAGALFDLYEKLYQATDAAVTPLIGGALESLGYDRAYTLQPSATPARVPAWDDAFAWDGHALTTLRPVTVDVGAAGKGYLVDILGALLRDAGHDDFVVDGSGDLLHAGGGGIRIGLENPLDTTKAIGIATVANRALCASASNRRAWAGMHHIIDPATGLPTRNVIATWAIADTALVADGLATALFFTGADRLREVADFQYVRMFSNGRIEHDFEGEIFA